MDKRFPERQEKGPTTNSRSQVRDGNFGRLSTDSDVDPKFHVLLADRSESIIAMGRSDDGSDDKIISPRVTKRAVIAIIGRCPKFRRTASNFTSRRR